MSIPLTDQSSSTSLSAPPPRPVTSASASASTSTSRLPEQYHSMLQPHPQPPHHPQPSGLNDVHDNSDNVIPPSAAPDTASERSRSSQQHPQQYQPHHQQLSEYTSISPPPQQQQHHTTTNNNNNNTTTTTTTNTTNTTNTNPLTNQQDSPQDLHQSHPHQHLHRHYHQPLHDNNNTIQPIYPHPQQQHSLQPPQLLSAPTAWISLAPPQQPPQAQSPTPILSAIHPPHQYYPAPTVHHHVHHPPHTHLAVHHVHPNHQSPPPQPSHVAYLPNDLHHHQHKQPQQQQQQPHHHQQYYSSGAPVHDPDRISWLEAELAAAHREIDALRTRLADFERERGRTDAVAKTTQSRYWTPDEHKRFLEALQKFGPKDVRAIANFVGSRSATQVRTHAQKYFLRMARETRGRHPASLQDARKRSRSESDLVRIGHSVSTPPDSPLMSSHPSLISIQQAAASAAGPSSIPQGTVVNSSAPSAPLAGASPVNTAILPSPLAFMSVIPNPTGIPVASSSSGGLPSHPQDISSLQPRTPSAALPPSGLATAAPLPSYQIAIAAKPPSPRVSLPPQPPLSVFPTNLLSTGLVRMQLDTPAPDSLPAEIAALPSSKPPNHISSGHSPAAVVVSKYTPPRPKFCPIPDSSGISLLSTVASERNHAVVSLSETPAQLSKGIEAQKDQGQVQRSPEKMEEEPAEPDVRTRHEVSQGEGYQ